MERMTSVDKAILKLRGRYEWLCAVGRMCALLRLAITIVLALVAIDVVFQCGGWMRAALDVAALAAVPALSAHTDPPLIPAAICQARLEESALVVQATMTIARPERRAQIARRGRSTVGAPGHGGLWCSGGEKT